MREHIYVNNITIKLYNCRPLGGYTLIKILSYDPYNCYQCYWFHFGVTIVLQF